MLWHLRQLILQLVTLNIQIHHILFHSGDLLRLVLSLSKLGITLDSATWSTRIITLMLMPSILVEATLEIVRDHVLHA